MRLLGELERVAGGKPLVRRPRVEPCFRIPVTPEIELIVRGAPQPDQLVRLECIAGLLRIIILRADGED